MKIAAVIDAVEGDHPSNLPPGPYLRLSVEDTGVGMDEETLARAIEPFFSTKGLGKGTGLGLSMVHGLAAQLGWQPWPSEQSWRRHAGGPLAPACPQRAGCRRETGAA